MSYNEHITYDKNGNINTLFRNGDLDSNLDVIEIDNLSYEYDSGNKLLKVTDSSNHPEGFKNGANKNVEYGYDDFGNMTRDDNKGISSITYNHLNLPIEIVFSGTPTRNISYIYNALGQKVSKSVTYGVSYTTIDYLGGFHYENEVLKFFATAEGYVNVLTKGNKTAYNYVYNYMDHLGNIRLSYTESPEGEVEVLEENHYYPFGLKHKKYGSVDKQLVSIVKGETYYVGIEAVSPGERLTYQYKYQSQEYQDELGLNWYSFKWRNYDPAIGRFFNPDPLSEKYAYQSHYNFSENRVIDGRELEGLEWENFRTTGKNPGSLKMKLPSSDAQRQHYSVAVTNSDVSFSDFKSTFKESPQKFLTNSKATFNSPVDGEGNSSDFEKGSFIKIDIKGPMNNAYVKVVGMEDKDDYMSATFATMEGHVEKGKITFRLYDDGDGNIRFTINSMSEVDMGLAPEKYSREQQSQSWNEVLSNISKYLGGEETKRESRVVEPKKEDK